MIRTREEMRHALVTSCSARQAWPWQQGIAVGRTHQQRRTGQDLSQHKRLPPLKENCKACDRTLWEQQAPAHQERPRTCFHVSRKGSGRSRSLPFLSALQTCPNEKDLLERRCYLTRELRHSRGQVMESRRAHRVSKAPSAALPTTHCSSVHQDAPAHGRSAALMLEKAAFTAGLVWAPTR